MYFLFPLLLGVVHLTGYMLNDDDEDPDFESYGDSSDEGDDDYTLLENWLLIRTHQLVPRLNIFYIYEIVILALKI